MQEKIGIPVKWIAFWPDVSGGGTGTWWTTSENYWAWFLLNLICLRDSKRPWHFSVIPSLKFAKGTKRITQKWRQLWQVVVFRCSVPLGDFFQRIFTEIFNHWCNMPVVPICILFFFFSLITNLPNGVHCTLCEKQKDEPNSGVQQCKCTNRGHAKMYPLYRNLQHVVYQDWMGGTQWHSTATYLKKKEVKMFFTQCYSNLTEKKTKKKGVLL